MDAVSIGAALALTGNAATKASTAATTADTAAKAANTAATAANNAATSADSAAKAAAKYSGQCDDLIKQDKMDNADMRLVYSQFQAYIRWLEKRVSTLESQVAALAGK